MVERMMDWDDVCWNEGESPLFYSKTTGSRTAMRTNDIKNYLEVQKLGENKQPHKK